MLDVAHGFHVYRDGDAWCAVGPHFINIMESWCGFGDTPEAARKAWERNWVIDWRWTHTAPPELNRFTIHNN